MMNKTGCDGVVVGRGCLGRPWLFANLVAALHGLPVEPSPRLGAVCDVMARHARLLAAHMTEPLAMRDFRKHTSWYFTGYPVGGETRRRFASVSSLAELDDLIAPLDLTLALVEGGERIRRGHTNGPIRVVLPHGYLQHLDDLAVPDDGHVMALSGG
jgi:tRNA-dihydrouridine synthase